eukprot:c42536_g1_i1 orf=96-245(+)
MSLPAYICGLFLSSHFFLNDVCLSVYIRIPGWTHMSHAPCLSIPAFTIS